MLPRYWTRDDDALVQSWEGERVWCNPPYGRESIKFVEKACEKDAEVAVLLLPARTDTRMWQRNVFPNADEIVFLRGRVRFVGGNSGAPFPSAVAIFRGDGDWRLT